MMQEDKEEQGRPYWWWQGASVAELITRLGVAGPNARLEVHIDAAQHATLVVVPPPTGSDRVRPLDPPINESHVCPPVCP